MTVAVWNAGVILVFPDCFAGKELIKKSLTGRGGSDVSQAAAANWIW